jgi:hypothetical protein
MPDLTDFQLEVTRLFFSLPASKGFLLAGGAGQRGHDLMPVDQFRRGGLVVSGQ